MVQDPTASNTARIEAIAQVIVAALVLAPCGAIVIIQVLRGESPQLPEGLLALGSAIVGYFFGGRSVLGVVRAATNGFTTAALQQATATAQATAANQTALSARPGPGGGPQTPASSGG